MSELLASIGAGAVFGWLALPLVRRGARLRPEREAASRHRAGVCAFALGAALFAVPLAREAWLPSSRDLPEWLSTLVHRAFTPLVGARSFELSLIELVGLAWILATAGSALAIARRALAIRGLVRRSLPAPPGVAARAARLARELGVVAPRVVVSAEAGVPFVANPARPVVVLPRRLVRELDDGALGLVLRHELVHVARGDLAAGVLVLLARMPFAFHPSARALAQEIRLAREQAVDQEVGRIAPHVYARVLVDVASGARAGGAETGGVAMHGTDLQRRVAAIGKAPPTRRASASGAFVVALAIGAAAALAPHAHVEGCPLETAAR